MTAAPTTARLPKRTDEWTCPNACGTTIKASSVPGNAAVDVVQFVRGAHAKAGCPNEPPPAPVPTLAEPGRNRIVKGKTNDIWMRDTEGWVLMMTRTIRADSSVAKVRMPLTWAELNDQQGPIVPMVRAPHLTGLVQALQETSSAWHREDHGIGEDDPGIGSCGRVDCIELRKLTGEASA